MQIVIIVMHALFLSTLSLRRATNQEHTSTLNHCISIHALLAESDRRHRGNDRCPVHFYPRSPCGERLMQEIAQQRKQRISIHALLAESDAVSVQVGGDVRYFYPRSPCGERRPGSECRVHPQRYFYPRSPCGERRCKVSCSR